VPDPTLELDTFVVREEGQPGRLAREILVVYENGVEKERVVQREWVEQEPINRVVAYGTNIVIRTLETPDGPIQYWRRTRMLATSGVIGAWIDLGYDEDNYKPWYRWVDVYWVAPPPPPDRIQYILPTANVP